MAKIKVLKEGETDIMSTDISKFAMHSEYKSQKQIVGSTTLTMVDLTGSANGTITHNLGYKPMFFAFIEHDGKGYESVGNSNPIIEVAGAQWHNYSSATDVIRNTTEAGSLVASGLSVNDVIYFKGSIENSRTPPPPLSSSTTYYVHSIVTSEFFRISTSIGGAYVDLLPGGGSYRDNWYSPNHASTHVTNVRFDINVDTTKMNITATANEILGPNFYNETFIVRAFFIIDEII